MARAEKQGRDPLTVAALLLAVVAFLGSFSHVQEVVNAHGQHGWISFAIACMPEVSVVLFVLKVRRARRTGEATVWAWIVGTSAAAFTVSANLATAEHSAWGYVVAAWPAWASIGAAGLIEMGGGDEADRHDQEDQGDRDQDEHDQGENPADAHQDSPQMAGTGGTTAADSTPRPAPVPTTEPAAVPRSLPAPAAKTAGKPAARPTGRAATSRPTGRPPAAVTEADVLAAGVTAEQLAAGRKVAAELVARGESLTRAGLFDGIRRQHVSIGTGPGGQLLALLKCEAATAATGTPAATADDVDQAAGQALDQEDGAPAAAEQTSGQTGMAGVVDLASHHHPDRHDHDGQPGHDDQEDRLQYLAHANGTHHDDGLVATIGGTR
jgi:hypothetical protein